MGNSKELLQVLWECVFMDTYKDVCTYYTIYRQEDNDGKIFGIASTLLRRRHYFKPMITIWESVYNILPPTVPPRATLTFSAKVLSTIGGEKIAITEICKNFSKNVFERTYKDTTLPQSGFVCFRRA